MRRKVFVIGMFKTGITSIAQALQKLGYRVFRGPWWNGEIQIDNWNKHPEKWKMYYDKIDIKVNGHDAFSDYPFMYIYEYLDKKFPDSQFILTSRNVDSVIKSTLNQMSKNHKKMAVNEVKEKIKNRYMCHQNMTKIYFATKKNLLIMNLEKGDGWQKLCKFLNKSQPSMKFPHENRGVYR